MILVVGSQRTGSTLMSMILGAHPALTLKGDPDLSNILRGDYGERDVLHAPVWTARYALIHAAQPDAKYIYMLRDIRAIVHSMMSLGNPSWADNHAVEETARAIACLDDWRIEFRVIPLLSRKWMGGDSLKNATLCAYLKSRLFEQYRDAGLIVFPVEYEELVSRPRDVLSCVVDFLGLEWHEDVMRHHALTPGKEFAGNDPKRPIDTAPAHRWAHEMSIEDQGRVMSIVCELDKIFNMETGARAFL